jgi:hypothetical protein
MLKDDDIKILSVYKWSRIGRTGMLTQHLGKQALGAPYIRWTVI